MLPVSLSEALFVEYGEASGSAIALGSQGQARDLLRCTWHAAEGSYDAIALAVVAAAPAGSKALVALCELGIDGRPAAVIWYGEIPTDSIGFKVLAFADGTIVDPARFVGSVLEVLEGDAIGKCVVFQGATTTARVLPDLAVRSHGRFDDGGALPVVLASLDLPGVSGAIPADLSVAPIPAPSKVDPVYLPLRRA